MQNVMQALYLTRNARGLPASARRYMYSFDENILSIVSEECAAYFSGAKTIDETAALIQNRVSLYMAEQK